MAYSTAKLSTVAQCDQMLSLATEKKGDLQFEQSGISRGTQSAERRNAKLFSDLSSVNAQITALTAARDAMPDGPAKTDMTSKIRRLNDRKDNLEERVGKGGNNSLLENELELTLLEKQIGEIDAFTAAVTARKAEL